MKEPWVKVRIGGAAEIIDLRHEILRAGLARQLAHFEGDDEPTTRHVIAESDGMIVGGAIVGCATILRRDWNGKPAWQLRGMAVAKQMQGRGVGAMMLDEIERIVRAEKFSDQLWCNARTSAASFYQRHGWQIASAEFFVEHAGMHVKMQKTLRDRNLA